MRQLPHVRAALLLLAALAAQAALGGDEMKTPGAMVDSSSLKWVDAPPELPKGAKVAVLEGDPGKPGLFTVRLRAPAGYKVAPHWHSKDERLTVLSGALYLGMGEKLETKKAHELRAGGYHMLPAQEKHYAFTRTITVVQITGEGPFDIQYVNPQDNPASKAANTAAK